MLDMPIAVKLSILILVVSTAITANLLLIAVFLRNHLLRTLSTYFVFSLAICDLLFSSVVMSLSVSGIASHQKSSAGIPCGLTAHLSCSLSLISVEMLTLMAINRYFKMVKPERYQNLFTNKSVIVFISLAWICGMTFGVLILAMTDWKFKYLAPIGICIPNGIPLILLVLFAMCTATIIVCYTNILRKIHRHHNSVAPSLHPSQGQLGRLGAHVMEIKITKNLSGVMISLFSCYILAVAMACVYHFTESRYPSLLFAGAVLRVFEQCVKSLDIWIFEQGNQKRVFKNFAL